MTHRIVQDITIRYRYPVVFTRDVFAPENAALAEILAPEVARHPHPRMLVIVEDAVSEAHPALLYRLACYLRAVAPNIDLVGSPRGIRGGEALKSDRARIDELIRGMAEASLDRHSFVMAIGGGAVLDAVGFAASLLHRGVRMIRLPTTVLSQNDGGVGVKTAINDPCGKNLLGTFAPPFAVLNDLNFLASLPDAEWRAGIAEAFKVAMIKDTAFFDWLDREADTLAARDAAAMERLVVRCAELHLTHIREGGDPFEMGRARPLDFGHWSAHHVEAQTGYQVGHGAAVAIGVALDSLYAVRRGWLPEADAHRLILALRRTGFTLWHEALERRDPRGRLVLFNGLERFREHLGGILCITVPQGVGHCMEISEIDEALMEEALGALRAFAL
ncbi:MAG TPA: 3-dehydroquinate synthase [Kiritimatiellia bacterium]|mgnify:FL=1|nr:3-dehydroquinate synthase [Kiritimatiellia bacterium]HMP96466.1 3-dehydroquinate synthase [Kiritimatiellia bacterium]